MSFDVKQLKLYIIIPTLCQIGLYSEAAVNLLLGTCAQESQLGTYLKQVKGPALGIYQMEPATHDDIFDNYLKYKQDLAGKVLAIDARDTNNLITNLAYATTMCRIKYLRAADALPAANDLTAIAQYWKKYYNTPLGKGCTADFIGNYKRYVGNV